MNLYVEAAKVLHVVTEKRKAVKTLVYNSDYVNKKQLFGLVCETLKFKDVLGNILEKTKLLEKERLLKNDALLACALLHDFVLDKKICNAGKLLQTVKRHKEEIYQSCESVVHEAGVEDIRELAAVAEEGLPRYVRINLLKTSKDTVVSSLTQDGWCYVEPTCIQDMTFKAAVSQLQNDQFMSDPDLPDLLVFPDGTDLHDNPMVMAGELILQDKASCFPAHILAPPPGAVVVDCCAAPGNKTTHLASLMMNMGKIYAFDKDHRRLKIMQKFVHERSASIINCVRMDFLKVDPSLEAYQDVEYLVVDPSCSGSGIVGRLNEVTDDSASSSASRLQHLANFQVTCLRHALTFPKVKRVVYSTCSIHEEENEVVVNEVLSSCSETFHCVKVFPDWPLRGRQGHENSECFLRMSPDVTLTNGFFIACIERKNVIENGDFVNGEEFTENLDRKKKKKHKKDKRLSEEALKSSSDTEEKKKSSKKKEKNLIEQKIKTSSDTHTEEETKNSKKKHKKKHKKDHEKCAADEVVTRCKNTCEVTLDSESKTMDLPDRARVKGQSSMTEVDEDVSHKKKKKEKKKSKKQKRKHELSEEEDTSVCVDSSVCDDGDHVSRKRKKNDKTSESETVTKTKKKKKKHSHDE